MLSVVDLPTRTEVAPDVFLDARLGLYHAGERWLAVADLHYGFERSLQVAGALLPTYGMDDIERRLLGLLADYAPAQLILAGDLVHTRATRAEVDALLARLSVAAPAGCEIIPLGGNHDRRAFADAPLPAFHLTERFCFHHGDAPAPVDRAAGRIVVEGHHHPAATLRDNAGLALKLPAFVQTPTRWILPAFSPWAAGGGGTARYGREARLWLCAPKRILPFPNR